MNIAKIYRFTVMTVMVMLIAGCAATLKNYGTFAPDTEVTNLFESGKQSDAYQYYYCGPESAPTALLGVKQGYSLEERLWQKIAPQSASYGKLLEGMRNRTLRMGLSLKGYTLSAPDKTPVGIWYSVFKATPAVHMLGDKIIEVLGPPSDLYERYEDKDLSIH